MRNYEVMFIVKSEIDEAAQKAVAEEAKKIFKNNGAKVTEETDMGVRELAYEIDHHKTGHYYLFNVESENSKAVDEFSRLAVINENIIRHLVVRKDA